MGQRLSILVESAGIYNESRLVPWRYPALTHPGCSRWAPCLRTAGIQPEPPFYAYGHLASAPENEQNAKSPLACP